MADSSTRRSVRARTGQPSSHHSSSSSSNSSHRAERGTRAAGKMESPRKSTPSASLSSEPADDSVAQTIEEGLQTRRSRKRGLTEEEDLTTTKTEEAMEDGEGEEDDGTVRCICGLAEYPGPPLWTEDDKKQFGDMEFITAEDVTEDLAGFFLSCDNCKVWQHGGCVGIKNEDVSPEEYYCEQCRQDLHRVFIATDGQKYSLYLPLQPNFSPSTSRAGSFSKDGTSEKGRGGRASSAQQNAKRRSTMNSRDAAYDEEEQLRRAIAASKGEPPESIDGGVKRGKRGRSDSEEKQESFKRQRTNSRSLSPTPVILPPESHADLDEENKARSATTKKIRGAAAKNHSAKEAREERERIRQEAANKRKGRAERRRIDDDSEPPEELPVTRPPTSVTSKASEAPTSNSATAEPVPVPAPSQPDTPPAAAILPPSQSNSQHKKSAAGGKPPPGGKKGKSGKNQYTVNREREPMDEESPGRSTSRDRHSEQHNHKTNGDETSKTNSTSHKKKVNGSINSKDSVGVVKVSWLEMRRKVAAMLDYIAKVQVEMADQKQYLSVSSNGAAQPGEEAVKGLMKGIAGSIVPILKEQEREGSGQVNGTDQAAGVESESVWSDEMGLLEMMEFLTRRLVLWQRRFGA